MIELKQDSRGVVLPVSAGRCAEWIVGVRNGMLRVAVQRRLRREKRTEQLLAY